MNEIGDEIQKDLSSAIGRKIKITKSNEQEISGVLLEVSRLRIRLRRLDNNSEFSIMITDKIESWEVSNDESSEVVAEIPDTPSHNHTSSVKNLPSNGSHQSSPAEPVLPKKTQVEPEVQVRLMEVVGFLEGKTQGTEIDVLPPSFTIPIEEFRGQKEALADWDKAKQRYDYALKINELGSQFGRIQIVISSLKVLVQRIPTSPGLKQHLAYLLYLSGNIPAAIKEYQQATILSQSAHDWHNLAALALKVHQDSLASYALEQVFIHHPLTDYPGAWYVFVGLLRKSGDYALLSHTGMSTQRTLSETEERDLLAASVYLLKSLGKDEIAQRLMCDVLKGKPFRPLLQEALKSLAGPVSEAYQQIATSLKVSKEKEKKVQPPSTPVRQDSIDKLFELANRYANEGEYHEAIHQIKQLLARDPDYPNARQLYEKWREYARVAGLPKGSNLWARAKRMQQLEKNFEDAVTLFYTAIRQEDNTQRAIKDLATLLIQLNRAEEAITVLKQNRQKITNQETVDNLLIQAYQKSAQYLLAIEILKQRMKRANTASKKVNLSWQIGNYYMRLEDYVTAEEWFREVMASGLENKGVQRNLALCLIKQDRYGEAEELLNSILPDDQATELLKAVAKARETGKSAQIEITIDTNLPDISSEISGFTRFFLERCQYEGVPTDRVQEKRINRGDVQKLEGQINRLGRKRPRERAEFCLSAAKIISELEEWDDLNQFYKYLCDSFASRGDAAVFENKHLDTARECYCEALSIIPLEGDQDAFNALVRFLSAIIGRTQVPMTPPLPTIDETLEKIFQLQSQKDRVFDAIAYVVKRSRFAAQLILSSLYKHETFQMMARDYLKRKGIVEADGASGLKEFTNHWNKLVRKNADEVRTISSELGLIAKVKLTPASVENGLDRIRAIEHRIFFDLDQQRIGQLQRILEMMLDLCKQETFEEQERLCTQVQARSKELLLDIEGSPTKLSIEELYPLVKIIQEKIDDRLAEIYESSVPKLMLRLPEDLASYIPDMSLRIEVQVVVENRMGCSPAESLELVVPADPDFFTLGVQEIKLDGSLRGGEQKILRVPLRMTEQALQSQAFSLPVYAQYRTRSGEMQQTDIQSFSIRLNSADKFEEIDNPYAAYAESGAVANREMFYGREELIANIAGAIRKARSQSKSYIIYGQKRAGKSSILYHLKNELRKDPDLLIVDLDNIGDLLDETASASFVHQILWAIVKGLKAEIAREEMKGRPPLGLLFPKNLEFYNYPAPLEYFKDIFESFRERAAQTPGWIGMRVVLLIDEFSYIYTQIVKGSISEEFMKIWKALLQKNYFGAVLVGQDVMPKFKQRFANEFGTTQDERVDYLDPKDATDLIDEPIRIGGKHGESRYRERALQRILDLTAGSPFYIQIISNRLVEYMNAKRYPLVTQADVEQVKQGLISGENALGIEKFDNLVNSGDTSRDAILDEDVLKVLEIIAVNSRSGSCSRNMIACETQTPVDKILDDLVNRKVVECQQNQYYRIKVELFKEWLIAHK